MTEQAVDLQGARILLVDDTPANLDVLCALLEAEGYDLALAQDGHQALNIARRIAPDLILLDVMMPGIDGFEVCRQLKRDTALQAIPVLFISARDRHQDILAGFQTGGQDYITKPLNDEEVLARVRTHLSLALLDRELRGGTWSWKQKTARSRRRSPSARNSRGSSQMIARKEAEHWGLEGFVGESPTIKRIFDEIRLVQEVPTSVLIAGESGTGKELIARAIHFGSWLREGPFVPVNCASLPGELADSLLFGHIKGAFTGADQDREGYFEMAHGGTLFLDELGEMALELQAKLLRVLEDGEVWRVGARQGRQVDVRVVAATNADVERRIQEGRFRQDLYFRVARFTVVAPPLRERREDIPLLAQHFLQLFAAEMGRDAPALSPEAHQSLSAYSFPGNVRELKNIIERALLESRGATVEPRHLHFTTQADTDLGHNATGPLLSLEENERRHIRKVLEATDWVVRGREGAASILGLPESTLRGKISKLGIER